MATLTRTPSRTSRRRSVNRGDRLALLLFLSPWLIGVCVFMLYPLGYSAYLSLTDYDVIQDPHWVGFANYTDLLTDQKAVTAMRNTVVYVLLSVPLHIVVAYGLALLLMQVHRVRGFFRTVFFLPKMTPPVAIGILLLLLFNGQNGLVNEVLGWVGIDGPAWTTDPSWVKPGLALMSAWTVGSSIVIFLAALNDVPRELYDAARVEGAGPWQRLRHVTIPLTSPALFFVLTVNIIAGFQTFTEAYTAFFGSAGSTYGNDAALFYSIYLFQQAFQFLHMGYASAMAVVLFAVIGLVTLAQMHLSRRLVFYRSDA